MGKITINICGGLGNQLFEIFFVIDLARQYNMEFFFPEKYQLDEKRHTYYNLFPHVKISNEDTSSFTVLREPDFTFATFVLNPAENYIFHGHFQSYKYLQHINPHDHFKLPENEKEAFDQLAKQIPEKSICLHVRRSDYLLVQHFHNILPLSYYKQALHKLNYPDYTVVIFSDDIPWCQDHFSFLPNKIFISSPDYLELFLMTKCQHHIIANSSFSWWGAYLNQKPNKKVIYPDKWFEANINTVDMCPPDWINCPAETKVCIAGKYHPKNQDSLVQTALVSRWKLVDPTNADIIFSSDIFINSDEFPTKRFIFGPHFSVLPTTVFNACTNKFKNAVYIQPSQQAVNVWRDLGFQSLPLYSCPFAVNIDKFMPKEAKEAEPKAKNEAEPKAKNEAEPKAKNEAESKAKNEDEPKAKNEAESKAKNEAESKAKNEDEPKAKKEALTAFVYYKRRDPRQLEYICSILTARQISYVILKYGEYTEDYYIDILRKVKYGIWLGSYENQGFALEEALSMNIPLLVWSTRLMKEEFPPCPEYENVKTTMTSIPYWSNSCGDFFYEKSEFVGKLDHFLSRIESFSPRRFIVDHLSLLPIMKNLDDIIYRMPMPFCKISVIIPSYNRYKYLLKAIDSVANQELSPNLEIELIVINDCSSQKEYYDDLYTALPKKTVYINSLSHSSKFVGNAGRAAYTRNIGLRVATGQYVAFLDDDDDWLPNKLFVQFWAIQQANVGLCCTNAFVMEQTGRTTYHGNDIPSHIFTPASLNQKNICITSSMMIDREIIKKIGEMQHIRVGEDYDYWLRALQHTSGLYLSTPYVNYDKNHGDGILY